MKTRTDIINLIFNKYNSFSMVSVWHWLENTFEVKIPDKEAIPFNFDNVNRMTEMVNKFKK